MAELIWEVYPSNGVGELATRRLELVAHVDGAKRSIDLGRQTGTLFPYNQSVCGPRQIAYVKEADEVAKVTFYLGGAATFAVTRITPSTLEVVGIQASDGYCPDGSCEDRRVITTIRVGEDARIVERVIIHEADGAEHPLACDDEVPTAALQTTDVSMPGRTKASTSGSGAWGPSPRR